MSERYDYKPPLGFDIRVCPDGSRPRRRKEAEPGMPPRACDWPGCTESGKFRAPRGRERLREFQFLCLDHVRAFNQSWDFFKGMTDDEVRRFQEDIATGHRPTWSMGVNPQGDLADARARNFRPGADRPGRQAHAWQDDLYDLLGRTGGTPGSMESSKPRRRVSRLQRDALSTLGLDESADTAEIKSRYKELVKRYHPDSNGGDRGAEQILQRVIKAYQTLRAAGFK
jgi:hypothetical protein